MEGSLNLISQGALEYELQLRASLPISHWVCPTPIWWALPALLSTTDKAIPAVHGLLLPKKNSSLPHWRQKLGE